MKQADANIYLDKLRPKKSGKCSLKIKVTFNRKRKYYSTGIDLTPDQLETLMNADRRTPEQKKVYTKVLHFLNKAQTIIEHLQVFTFDNFEEAYFEQRNITNSVSFAFEKCIAGLKEDDRIGTALSYECAKNSIEQFKKDLSFADITSTFLKKYERWMLGNDRSVSTVGIYLRSLRTIYNQQNIDSSVYPFGSKKGKYTIPTSRNIKKALTLEEIARIYNYEAEPNSTKAMAKDYWMFLYLCNGMNVKDFCLLKWGNIEADILTYQRAKTSRTQRESKRITVALKPQTKAIIKKWGRLSISKDVYIFPHLQTGMDAVRQREIYQQLTKTINKYIKQIAKEVGINRDVTTYFARHSFATVLKRSGAKTEMISELLGHSSVAVTTSYLDSFEKEQIQQQTDVLTSGFKEAK